MKGFFPGLLIGLLLLPAAVLLYFRFGTPPVAVNDKPFPLERQIVHVPLKARVGRDMPRSVPIEASAANLEMGAQIYREQCAACHGLQQRASDYANQMYPEAPQLWEAHHNGIVGVSDDPPAETYWKVANGIRLTGMPAFQHVLSQTQMWQVSLLLANADKQQLPAVMELLRRPLDPDPSANPPTSMQPASPKLP